MFCSLADLDSESDVEQKLLWQILSAPTPRGLGFASAEILTKRSMRRLPIGKGATAKLYYPDYLVLISGVPLLVVEAKKPGESAAAALAEARLYASQLNERFPTGINPCRWAVACNGADLVASTWDSAELVHRLEFGDINIASQTYAAFVAALGREDLGRSAERFRAQSTRRTVKRALKEIGGASVRNEEIGHNTFGSTLALDFRHVFTPSSAGDRAYVVRNAYVRSKRRDHYVEPIEKIIREIALPATDHIATIEDSGDPREVLRTLDRGATLERQILLLIGSVGSGKTTFVDHLVNVALPPALMGKTLWLRINLNLAPRENCQSWVVQQVVNELRQSAPDVDFDDLEKVLNLYAPEVNKLRKGPLKLLDPESLSYQERFTDALLALQRDTVGTARALSRFLCAERGKLMVLVLDNADKGTRDEQLEVFQIAQWIQTELRCLTILPLRDVTYDTNRTVPPLDTVQKDLVFRIEPPQFTSVLSRRVALALKELAGRGEEQLEYKLPNGIRVTYPASDQGMYLASILRSLYEHDRFLRRLLSGLAGRNIRHALEIFLEFCQSGYINEGEILKIRQFKGNHVLPLPVVASVLLRLHRRFYDGDASFIKNLFQANPADAVPDHFVRLAILRFLEVRRRVKGPSGAKGYHPVADLLSALVTLGHSTLRANEELLYLAKHGCVIAEHQRADHLEDRDLIALSSAGAVHLEMLGSIHYLAACAEDTWMNDPSAVSRVVTRIGESRLAHMAKATVLLNAREMVDYLGAFADEWHSESEAFLEPDVIERLHDWSDALATVEMAEDEQNQEAKSGRLYIGNLPYTVTREQLAGLFADAALPVIDLHVPLDATQRARGFAFVSVGTAEATKQSIAKLNGAFVDGRRISVRVADPRRPPRS